MRLSSCIWVLSGPDTEVLRKHADLGFTTVDVRPASLRDPDSRTALKDLGLTVSCMAISQGLPEGATFDSPDRSAVQTALDFSVQALDHAASLGATAAYIVPDPPGDADTPRRIAAALTQVADHGADLGIRICIEHFPGRAFPTAARTLDFLSEVSHNNLYLLFDIGHAQMSKESSTEVIARAGARLGYVHLDDNDGANDLHLALTDGVMVESDLRALFHSIEKAGYAGPVSLEIKNDLPDPYDSLRRSREIVTRLWHVS